MGAQHANAHIHQLEVEVPAVVTSRQAECGKVHEAAGSLACDSHWTLKGQQGDAGSMQQTRRAMTIFNGGNDRFR